MSENEDRHLAEAVIQALLSANSKVFENIKEDKDMGSALMELMKPEVELLYVCKQGLMWYDIINSKSKGD